MLAASLKKFIPSIIIPEKLIEYWLSFRAKKANSEFEKIIRRLSHYATHHGARSTCMRLFISMDIFIASSARKKAFFKKCHEGFSEAQNEIVKLLLELEAKIPELRSLYREEVRRYKKDRKTPIPRYSKGGLLYSDQLFKIAALKEIANSIAWQILGNDGTKVRALIQGVSPGPLQKENLKSVLMTASKLTSQGRASFALITDITSCIQVGDLLIRLPSGQFGLCELKEGVVNDQIEFLLNMPPQDQTTADRFQRLANRYGNPFIKQFERVLKQKQRMKRAVDYINNSVGIDIQYKRPKITDVKPRLTVTYEKEVDGLLRAAKKHGEKYLVVDECLVIGAFDNRKLKRSNDVCKMDFQHQAWHMFFEDWSECPYGKKYDEQKAVKHFEYMLLPIWKTKDKVHFPTHRPIFIAGLAEEFIFDILFDRMSLYFYFSPQRFVALCKKKEIDAVWITGKEYRKIKSDALGDKIALLDIHDGIIQIKDESKSLVQNIGLGTLFKIIYEFERPSAIIEQIKEDLETLPDRLSKLEGFEKEKNNG